MALLVAICAGCARQAAVEGPDELIKSGWSRYRMGEYNLAIEAFTAALDAVPQDDARRHMALYGLASTWNLRMPVGDQDKAEAERLYDLVIAEAPRSDLAAWSLLAKARMLHLVPVGREPDYAAVREAYAEAYRRFPGHHAGQEAFIHHEATQIAEWDRDAARESGDALRGFIARHPDSDLLGAAYDLLAACHQILDDPRARLDALVENARYRVIDPDSPAQENSWVYWRIATLAEFEVGDFETARRFYRQLLEEYPRDIRRYGAEKALRRMDELETRLREENAEGSAS